MCRCHDLLGYDLFIFRRPVTLIEPWKVCLSLQRKMGAFHKVLGLFGPNYPILRLSFYQQPAALFLTHAIPIIN